MRVEVWLCLLHLCLALLRVIARSEGKEYNRYDFPTDFVFGASTSAYQVEGAALEDGRKPSIYDTFAHRLEYDTGNPDVACDQYHKYKEDVQLMVETGLDAYRFSISWSRLIPDGRGAINPKGLRFYNNLINELISHGIEPHVTLLHTDLPQVLEDEYRGFLNPKIIEDFTSYADVCFREFGDRVRHWTTFNEANIFVFGGYDVGNTPPSRCSFPFGFINCTKGNSTTEPYIAAHHILLAHGYAVKLYKDKYKTIFPNEPLSLERVLKYYKDVYENPIIFIHENGQAASYNTSTDDSFRVEYIRDHVESLHNAVRNGSNAKGYFVWSLLDVYELLFGFDYTFGIYYVDYNDPNLTRHPKLSQQCYLNSWTRVSELNSECSELACLMIIKDVGRASHGLYYLVDVEGRSDAEKKADDMLVKSRTSSNESCISNSACNVIQWPMSDSCANDKLEFVHIDILGAIVAITLLVLLVAAAIVGPFCCFAVLAILRLLGS
uniref:Uncharacterized protein n=1 Tax=Chenopodium quinoa TaxID=63459 RepID=A0A803MPC9_CHEQI